METAEIEQSSNIMAYNSCTKLHYGNLDLAIHPAKMFSTVCLIFVELIMNSYN